MVGVVLFILKIILWILLAIIGLIVLAGLLVLFSPIRYRLQLRNEDNLFVGAKVRFLVASIELVYDKTKEGIDTKLKLFCITLKGRKNAQTDDYAKEWEEIEPEVHGDAEEKPAEPKIHADAEERPAEPEIHADAEERLAEPEVHADAEVKPVEPEIHADAEERPAEPKNEKQARDKSRTRKIKSAEGGTLGGKLEGVKSFFEAASDKKDKILAFLELDYVVKTRKYLKKYIFNTIKHVSPRRIKGYVRYGFEEPSKTGMLTGYLSLFPFVYQKDFELAPDFKEKIFKADFICSGKIRIGYLIRIIFKISLWRTVIGLVRVIKK